MLLEQVVKNNDVFKETLEGFVKEDSPLQES